MVVRRKDIKFYGFRVFNEETWQEEFKYHLTWIFLTFGIVGWLSMLAICASHIHIVPGAR